MQLAKDGKRVTIVEMLGKAEVLPGWPRGLIDQLDLYGVDFRNHVKLDAVTDTGAVVTDDNRQRFEIPADTVILSLGFRPRTAVVDQFHGLPADVFVVGDCLKPRALKEAIHDGFNVAVEL